MGSNPSGDNPRTYKTETGHLLVWCSAFVGKGKDEWNEKDKRSTIEILSA